MPLDRTQAVRGVVAVSLALGVALHAAWWLPYLCDDSLISLRYADRLLSGAGLTWSDAAPPTEGYSNLLWVLGEAAIGLSGVDLILGMRILGFGSAMALAVVMAQAGRGLLAQLTAGMVVVTAVPVALWAAGGLEAPALALAIGVAVLALDRDRLVPASIALSAACLLRPDAPLLAALLGVGLWLAQGQDRRALWRVLQLGLGPVVAVAGQLAFRLWAYADWVPNTAHVKGPSDHLLDGGLLYVAQGLWTLAPVLGLALAGLWLEGKRGRLVLPAILGWTAWVASIGGDLFPGFRHLAPLIPLLALPVAGAVDALPRWAAALSLPLVLWSGQLQLSHPRSTRAHTEHWQRDCLVLGAALVQLYGEEQPTIAVPFAGCLPYSTRFPAIDTLGLNDAELVQGGTQTAGPLGHGRGDARLTLDREPDLIFLCGPFSGAPCFPVEVALVADPRFEQDYELRTLETSVGQARYFARRR